MTFRPMPILTGLSLISLVILILLGNWQYARYAEKMANPSIVEQAETRSLFTVTIDQSHAGNTQQVYGFADSEPIWRRYAPGKVQETGELVLVMVEATGGAAPVPIAIADLPETVRFEGFVAERSAASARFAGRDDPEADTWYRLNPEALSARLSLDGVPKVAEPVMMSVRNAADLSQVRQTLNPYAFAKPVDPLPPERHFGYALTWWGMALGLIGVYVALHHARGRLRFKKA
ncbi:MAG: SURF1 family cytochrome oxidase biogenesis protein [Pseudomonadota bacterium]